MEKDVYNLSKPQESIWLTEQYFKNTNINRILCYADFSSKIDTIDFNVLKKSLNLMLEHNDVFRTRLFLDNGIVKQYLCDFKEIDFPIYEISSFDDFVKEESERQNIFTLFENPLFEFKVFKLKGTNTGGVIANFHHIICDAITTALSIRQVAEIYNSLICSGNLPEINPDNFSYTQYLLSEKEYIQSEKFLKDKAYWEKVYETVPEVATIYSTKSNQNSLECGAERATFVLDNDIMTKINALCADLKISAYNFFMAVFGIYISRNSRLDDFSIGTPILNRTNYREKNTFGMYISTVPFRMKLDNNMSFTDFVSCVAKDTLSMLRHQKYSYQYIIEDLRKKDSSIPNLYNIMLSYQINKASDESCNYTTGWLFNNCTNNDLDIHIYDFNTENVVNISYDYNLSKYSKKDIDFIHPRIINIINQIIDNKNILLKNIEITTPEEKLQILNEFNNTKTDYPNNESVISLFEKQVKLTPNNIAVVFEDKKLTYKELNEKANSLARYILNNYTGKNSIVAILMDRSIEVIVSILAVLKAGKTYIPIDPNYPIDRILYMLEDSNCELALTKECIFSKMNISLAYVDVSLLNDDIYSYSKENLKTIINPDDLSYIIYTSGSTGKPKGVMLTYKGINNLISYCNDYVEYLRDNSHKTIVSVTTISFDIFFFESIISLQKGLKLVIATEEQQTIPRLLFELIKKEKIEIIQTTPSRMKLLIDNINDDSDLDSLKYIVLAGEQFPMSLANRLRKFENINLYNGYGPSETTVFSTLTDVTNVENMTIGKPLYNTQIYILDKNMNLLPNNIPGEICISGNGVGKGYINSAELTKKSFVKNPFMDNILYKTGDLGYYNCDGTITCLGRIDNQVKIRGLRIELEEIEKAILKIDGVTNCIVDKRVQDNGHEFLCAYYTSQTPLEDSYIRNKIKSSLTNYMIPQFFMELPKMPYTPNGKIDRKALPIPTIKTSKKAIKPLNNNEKILVEIFENVLNIENIGIDDDFFDLGGDSLSAINLSTKIYDKLNIQLSVKFIFDNPTIRQLSKKIESTLQNNTNIKIEKAPNCSYYPTSSAQKRIYFSSVVAGENSTLYNIPSGIILDREPDIEKLEFCFKKLIEKHESLRTFFRIESGNLVQQVVDNINFNLKISNENYKDIDKCFNDFVKPFNLGCAPLFRAKLIKFENGKYLLLFDMHHIISDGTSLNIFINDLCSLYNNNNDILLTPSLTYKDFAVWENNNKNDKKSSDDKNYWISMYKNDIPVLNMPTNFPRPLSRSFTGSKVIKVINKDLTKHIMEFSKSLEITPYMLLLASYYILLSKYSMQDDIVVGSPVIARNNPQLENIIGMFVNTLPLKINVKDNFTINEFLLEVKELCLSSFDHQTYPLEEIVNNLSLNRYSNRNTLFDTTFTYQNNGYGNVNLKNIKTELYIPDTKISKFDFSLEVIPNNGLLTLSFEYCTDLFEKDFINTFANHYINILSTILDNKEIKVSDIDMLTSDEKNMILHDFNDTHLDYPSENNLVDLFKQIVTQYPKNIAVQFGGKKITYKELDEKSNFLAHKLIEKGAKSGNIIGVCMNKSIELVISIWAILKIGCAYMPMYIGYPKERLEYMLTDSNCKLLLINSTMKKIIKPNCDCIEIENFEQIKESSKLNFASKILPMDTAYIIYTSGSTGKPKGVKIAHKNLINYIFSFNKLFKDISSQDRFLSSTSISFDVSIWELFLSILNGATLVIYSEELISNIIEYARNIIDYKITTLYIPPNILEEVYALLKHSKDIKIDKILVGVEPIKKNTLNKFYELNPNMKIVNGYGPTETTICSTALIYKKDESNNEIVSIGKPLSNTNIYIVDKNMHLLPIGVPGELCISGDGVGNGYINNITETNSHFVNNVFDDSSKLYKSGDIAKWNKDGTISYIARKDNQIKFSGYRIELKEIETVIMQYPSITKNLATIYNNEKKSYLVSYFTADKKLNTSDLSAYLQTKLPYYMIPSIFIQLDSFPINVNGKIDRSNLPKPEVNSVTTYVPPSNDLEEKLCSIWEELFGIEKIGINDNFFDLGGDSLSAIKFQIEALNYNLNISYSDIFLHPTIKLLAAKTNEEIPDVENFKNYNYKPINKILSKNKDKYIHKKIKIQRLKNILLTGATGFLGAHILDTYLSSTPNGIAYCLVRRKDLTSPEVRLRKTLEFYFGDKYNNAFGNRIKVVTADITLDNFGLNPFDYDNLSKKIDIVINSAALVKHYGEYNQFNNINVLGTQRLVDFCKTYRKKLYHISTASVSGMGLPENNNTKSDSIMYFSESDLFKNQNLNNTYIRTKFEAERLILENVKSGLNACIFRMGNISNRYYDAKFQINVSENAFVNRIKAILKLQLLQDGFKNHSTEFAPVDICAQAIIKIIQSNPKFTVFHIFNYNLISFESIVNYVNKLGLNLEFVPDEIFAKRITEILKNPETRNEISGIVSELTTDKVFRLNANILLDCTFTKKYLEKLNFKWPIIDEQYIINYISYFRKINYFN